VCPFLSAVTVMFAGQLMLGGDISEQNNLVNIMYNYINVKVLMNKTK